MSVQNAPAYVTGQAEMWGLDMDTFRRFLPEPWTLIAAGAGAGLAECRCRLQRCIERAGQRSTAPVISRSSRHGFDGRK
ncbi:MAG TPA: hypothetical protein VLI90_14620 [Tepidisphaeraceae bacterium]|nr:hypothetical protein [Tepidisphaeraceae bacterium]